MYNLYFDKENMVIKISQKIKKGSPKKLTQKYTDEVVQFNWCYYISTDRKKLKAKAVELKEQWISEAEQRLETCRNIKI